HKTFINPSLSEVLCTTTAEAIAMGKFAVMPDHPSNEFFKRFKNAPYYDPDDEALALVNALESEQPEPDPTTHELTWER
ncbi:MAG: hexosyltransferase, partial [Cyanobacteria bacterium P01_H01_bin.130]